MAPGLRPSPGAFVQWFNPALMLKQLLGATTAAALLLLGAITPATAAQDPEVWGRAIAAAGIGLEKSTYCRPGELASYTSRDRTIWMCPLALTDTAPDLYETIGHELVHAIQHCAGRVSGTGRLMPLALFFHQNGDRARAEAFASTVYQRTLNRNYEVNRSLALGTGSGSLITEQLEREAYALENEHALILKLLPLFCGN